MSTWNGRAMADGHSDTIAARCVGLLERGMKKFGIAETTLVRQVKPSRGVDITPRRDYGSGERRRSKRDVTPFVGMTIQQIVAAIDCSKLVAGQIRARIKFEAEVEAQRVARMRARLAAFEASLKLKPQAAA